MSLLKQPKNYWICKTFSLFAVFIWHLIEILFNLSRMMFIFFFFPYFSQLLHSILSFVFFFILLKYSKVWMTGAGLSPVFKRNLEKMKIPTQNGLFSSQFLNYFAELSLPKVIIIIISSFLSFFGCFIFCFLTLDYT